MYKAKRDFPYSKDGITAALYAAGDDVPVNADQAAGLLAEGYIFEVGAQPIIEQPKAPVIEGTGTPIIETAASATHFNTGIDGSDRPSVAIDDSKFASIEIDPKWGDLSWPHLRSLGTSLSDTPVNNRPDAIKAIQAELDRREAFQASVATAQQGE